MWPIGRRRTATFDRSISFEEKLLPAYICRVVAVRREKLVEVFDHPLVEVWNHDLGWNVVEVLDAHKILFTTIDFVFKIFELDETPGTKCRARSETGHRSGYNLDQGLLRYGCPQYGSGRTSPSLAGTTRSQTSTPTSASRTVLYARGLHNPSDHVGPECNLVHPLKARPDAEGRMAFYLAEANLNYVRRRSAPPKHVLLLCKRAFTNLVNSIMLGIGYKVDLVKYWRMLIEGLKEREKEMVADPAYVEKAKADRINIW